MKLLCVIAMCLMFPKVSLSATAIEIEKFLSPLVGQLNLEGEHPDCKSVQILLEQALYPEVSDNETVYVLKASGQVFSLLNEFEVDNKKNVKVNRFEYKYERGYASLEAEDYGTYYRDLIIIRKRWNGDLYSFTFKRYKGLWGEKYISYRCEGVRD